MAGWKKPEEPPKNIPSIKVRQQWTTKCGETCGGQEEARQKIYPPCGPSPPSSGPLDLTCGMRDCMELDPCSCRCHCALRELMRAGLDPVATATQDSLVTEVPLAHMARIHTLEPRCSEDSTDSYNRISEMLPPTGCLRSRFEQMEMLRSVGAQTSPERSETTISEKSVTEPCRTGYSNKTRRREQVSSVSRWWLTYGNLPPEPCHGHHCFFGSPVRAFNRTSEVLGTLPEWNIRSKAKRLCHLKCAGRLQKI